MVVKCPGCGNVIHLDYFPDDFPESMMLCCSCLLSCYWRLKVSGTPDTRGYSHNANFNREWWRHFGKEIEKVIDLK